MSTDLAIFGGEPVRKKPFPVWPRLTEEIKQSLIHTYENEDWGVGSKTIALFNEQFANIHFQSFNQRNLRFTSKFILSLLIKPNTSYIYRIKKGFCIFNQVKEESEIITMAILPKYQNQGIGFSIIKELEEILLSMNCNKVYLEVACDNLIAIRLYEKIGFKSYGIRKKYYSISKDKKIDAILMKKIME